MISVLLMVTVQLHPLGAREFTLLRIATEGARPPFNYIDTNEAAGFEIDLAKDICRRLKAKCEFIIQDWDHLIPELLLGHYDMIMSALDITDERRAKIDFSTAYVNMPSAFLAQREAEVPDTSPEALTGKRIGAEAGGAHESFLTEVYKKSEFHPYATLEEAILDLGSGRIDLVLGERDAIGEFLNTRKEGDCCRIVGSAGHDQAYFGDGIGIGLRKTDIDLKEAINGALQEIHNDGTFARIRAKYFDFEIE
jgi:polar amino acid transport system substrate-binding protein